jgi:hypothetical protein
VPQVLLHTHPQDKQGVLVRQVDELGDGGSLVVDLPLEELFSGGACAHAGSQHPKAVGADVLQSKHLALGGVEADGWLPVLKESQRLLKCQVVGAEDVDVVEVGQDESVWAKGCCQVSEQ